MRVAFVVLVVGAVLAVVSATAPHSRRSLSGHHAYVQRSLGKNRKKRCTLPNTRPTSSSVSQPKPSSNASESNLSADITGIITVVDKTCGPNGATKQITKTTGPNGSIDWLNCGISAGGWTPPMVKASDITFVSLSNALQSPQSPYKPCAKYISLFEKYGAKYNVPPILLAAIAMQESTCNPNESGGGLMQISSDKCGGAPNGNCNDVNYNVETATKFFADTLDRNNGNILLTMGQYNGWFKGLTFSKATAAADSGCCVCQNNLDYPHQVFNGWLQNIDPRVRNMGKYFNLAKC